MKAEIRTLHPPWSGSISVSQRKQIQHDAPRQMSASPGSVQDPISHQQWEILLQFLKLRTLNGSVQWGEGVIIRISFHSGFTGRNRLRCHQRHRENLALRQSLQKAFFFLFFLFLFLIQLLPASLKIHSKHMTMTKIFLGPRHVLSSSHLVHSNSEMIPVFFPGIQNRCLLFPTWHANKCWWLPLPSY